VDDLSDFVLPRIFNDGMGYSANIGTGRIISDPRRTTRRLPDADMDAAGTDGDGGDLVLEDLEAENEYTPKKNVRGGI
jgi:hypothetical protein